MTKAPRENRVPIMMSETEVDAIDSWRFDNRVATRSEAVRRLVQLGLSLAEVASAMEMESKNRCRRAMHVANRIAALKLDLEKTERLHDHLNQLIKSEVENLQRVSTLAAKVRIFSSGEKVEDAMRASVLENEKMVATMEAFRAGLAGVQREGSKS